ncbi:MAG: glutamine-hydrolyzing carbamoyl-phosphate synthase small subunit [Rhodobacteraceae bacterium]|nr:glutamine-hydrolyzing carbamoyl-phosphate synthase small subunit [Paracoccaceae bacterium]
MDKRLNSFEDKITGLILLSDGTVIKGQGFGAKGIRVGELCFNTSMTGYQEIISDPSYCNQIVCFTFPHIGNVGSNPEDYETETPVMEGIITKWPPTQPSNWRSQSGFDKWLINEDLVGITGVDTRALTRLVRDKGALDIAIIHSSNWVEDLEKAKEMLASFSGLMNKDLAKEVTRKSPVNWDKSLWDWPEGYSDPGLLKYKVASLDFGAKDNILRCLSSVGAISRVFPAESTFDEIMEWKPDGIFLSNGPGDPEATATYIVPLLEKLIATGIPIFGICLGHQLLAFALGAKTVKMSHGHHGANHPVKELDTNKVEITTMNHGFMVDRNSLPQDVEETHVSLFDGTNCGLRSRTHPVYSVQFHPEASPGPQDSFYLFKRFESLMEAYQKS